jgi:hypothetical protein
VDSPEVINQWLDNNYGKTIEGHPLFRVIWSTGLTEHRKSRFIDHVGDSIIRDVVETREVLVYPFAQDRWILERICLIQDQDREIGLQTDKMFTYNEIYTFQDAFCNPLPLNMEMVKAAMFLFFKFYVKMTLAERINFRMEQLAMRELARHKETVESLGDLRSPFGFVLER